MKIGRHAWGKKIKKDRIKENGWRDDRLDDCKEDRKGCIWKPGKGKGRGTEMMKKKEMK